jgi:protein ImuB
MGFAAIYIPDFMVQAVVRAEPELREGAIALIEGTPPLRKVVAANDAALRAGIELGMSESQTEDFGAVEIRPRSAALEKTAHAAVLDLGWSISPRVEDTAADTIVLDLAGLTSLFGSDEIIAEQLVERAGRLGMAARVAIASNLEAAIHAARGFPGITLIPAGEEARWLGRLPVSVLVSSEADSPGAEMLETLESWGVRTCEALAALPVMQLSERLGQEGVRLHELARGASAREMVIAEPDTFFEEEMELEDAVPELEPLSFLLGRLLDQLCARLEARSLAAASVRMRFELEPASENSVRTLHDLARREAPPIYEKLLTLPVPTRNSKMLLKLLRLRLQAEPPQAAVLKILMVAEAARPRFAQGGLFLPSSPDPEKLELTIARLANLVGEANVGMPELVDTHRPDAFQVRRFVASGTSSRDGLKTLKMRRESRKPGPIPAFEAADSESCEYRARISFRVFRPSVPAKVELHEGRPARVSFHNRRGVVVAASGPWRTSGDWWREDAWAQDEWDVEVRFGTFFTATASAATATTTAAVTLNSGGRLTRSDLFSSKAFPQPAPQLCLFRIYYDAQSERWFVRGIYD